MKQFIIIFLLTYLSISSAFAKDVQDLLIEAEEFQQLHQYVKAKRHYQQALQQLPNDINILMKLASISRKLGNKEDAIWCLNKIIKLDPNNTQALLQRAQRLDLDGRIKAARQDYEQVLTLNPEQPQANLGMANINKREGNVEAAKSHFDAYTKTQQRPTK